MNSGKRNLSTRSKSTAPDTRAKHGCNSPCPVLMVALLTMPVRQQKGISMSDPKKVTDELLEEFSRFNETLLKEEVRMAVEALVKLAGQSAAPKMFADQVMQEHRSVQQALCGIMLSTIVRWANLEGYDARNKETIRLCRKLTDVLELNTCVYPDNTVQLPRV